MLSVPKMYKFKFAYPERAYEYMCRDNEYINFHHLLTHENKNVNHPCIFVDDLLVYWIVKKAIKIL